MRIQNTLLILFALSGLALCYDTKYCLNEGLTNKDCGWYTNCLENAYNCGSDGYPVGYGYKYCSRFVEKYNNFSAPAKKWIDGTLSCLKTSLKDTLINNNKYTCDNVKKIAFDSHPKCYVENGFCELFTKADIQEIYSTILSLTSVYQFMDFLSLQSIKQVTVVAYQCLQSKL
ncbi:hypothetical protein ABPG74_001208 [Tetrahymena malaccensis]